LAARESEFSDDDPRKIYLSVMAKLRALKLELQVHPSGGSGGLRGFDGDGSRGMISELGSRDGMSGLTAEAVKQQRACRDVVYQEKIAQLNVLLDEKKALEQEISTIDEDFALAHQQLDTTPQALTAQCCVDEAVVLVFDVEELNNADELKNADEVNSAEVVTTLHACVIHQGKVIKTWPLSMGDDDPISQYEHYYRQAHQANRGGLRDIHQPAVPETRDSQVISPQVSTQHAGVNASDILGLLTQSLATIDRQLTQSLWEPLQALLPQVSHWQVITHGSAVHALPLHNTLPKTHRLNSYPGILFFYQRHHQPDIASERSMLPSAHAIHHDDAIGSGSPIPFVHAETSIVAQLTKSQAISTGDETALIWQHETPHTFDSWHFSSHGCVTGTAPIQTQLVLDNKAGNRLGMSQLISSNQRPRVVILSACVVGQVHHLQGEPVGVNAGFQLKGADYVVAPTQPVSDFYMPLFMALYYQAWITLENPELALIEAKRRLTTGDWYEGSAQLIRQAYFPVINKILGQKKSIKQTQLRGVSGWLLPDDIAHRFSSLTASIKKTETNKWENITEEREQITHAIIEHLIEQRASLPVHEVLHLCAWIKGFGQVRTPE